MLYRSLGATGLKLSVLGFGSSPLGGVFASIDEEEGKRAVRAALDLGVNFFDASPFYGMTRAEKVLGDALADVPRDCYLLATKVGRYGNDPRDFDFSARRIRSSIDESLRRLRVEYVDIVQCHDIEFGDLNQIVEEAIPALRREVEAGKVRYIGITGLPLRIFPAIIERAPVDTALSYCHYALNDTSLEQLIPYLRQHKIGVINAAPLSMGLLTDGGVPAWHPAPAEVRGCCARAAAHCRERGIDIAQLAIQFAVANPAIETTLVGISSAEEIARNVRWACERPDPAVLAEVLEILAPIHNRTWPSGRPENN